MEALQRAANKRRRARGLNTIVVDGEWGPITDAAVREVAWVLGISKSRISGAISPEVQALIRDPDQRFGRRPRCRRSRAGTRRCRLKRRRVHGTSTISHPRCSDGPRKSNTAAMSLLVIAAFFVWLLVLLTLWAMCAAAATGDRASLS